MSRLGAPEISTRVATAPDATPIEVGLISE